VCGPPAGGGLLYPWGVSRVPAPGGGGRALTELLFHKFLALRIVRL
jgi:hypothetical protein